MLAVEVFADSSLINVQEALETQLVQNMRHLHPELASELLYKLTSRQFGTRTLITATVKRVELDSHMAQNLAPETVCQSLIALNLAGVDPSKEEFSTYAKSLATRESLDQLSIEEITCLDKLCRTL